MIIATAKKYSSNRILDSIVLYNTDKKEVKVCKLSSTYKLLKNNIPIINMKIGLSNELEIGECNQGLTVLNCNNVPVSAISWLVTTVDKTGVVTLVSYTGEIYTCMWNDLIYLISQVANAWIVNGVIYGFFKSQYIYARALNYTSYYPG